MSLADFHGLIRPLWLVWLTLLFVGIVIWVYWPRRKRKLEEHGQIPLRDEDQER